MRISDGLLVAMVVDCYWLGMFWWDEEAVGLGGGAVVNWDAANGCWVNDCPWFEVILCVLGVEGAWGRLIEVCCGVTGVHCVSG